MEFNPQVEDIDFNKYWLILKRRWLPSSAVFLIVMIAAIVMSSLQKPVYEASGKLLFKKRDFASTILNEGTASIGQLESLSNQNSPIDTEAEVLRSIPLIEKTIAALNLKRSSGEPVAAEDVIDKLSIRGIKGTDILSISYQSRNPKEAAAIVNQLIETYIESNILINRTEAKAAREFITQQLPKTEANLRRAESRLRKFDEINNIVSLPDEAKSAVDSIATLNQKLSDVQASLANTSAQSRALRNKLGLDGETAMALNSLSQSVAVQTVLTEAQKVEADLATQRQLYRPRHPIILQLEQRQAALNALLQSRITQVLGKAKPEIISNLQAGESEQKLIDNLIAVEVSRLGLVKEVESLSKDQSLYQQRANLLPRLEQQRSDLVRQVATIQSSYEILAKRLQEVEIAENQNVGNARVVASASVPTVPVASKKNLILMGGIVVGGLLYVVTAFVLDLSDPSIKTTKEARECFNYPWLGMIPMSRKLGKSTSWMASWHLLVTGWHEASLDHASASPNVQGVKPTLNQSNQSLYVNTIDNDIEGKPNLFDRLSFVFLCFMSMLFRARQHQNTLSKRDWERLIPELPTRDYPHSLESQAYQMLQANLKFLKPDQGLKTVVVTSSVSKEGKSTVSANLALSLSQMGRRVLLVDADLHYPMQHHIWGLTNRVGLSHLVVNQAELSDAIAVVQDNLSVLSAGAIPPNPLALIDSNRMNSLVNDFAATYDFVIFDAPPLALVPDVLMLGKMTDGILLVAHLGVVDLASAITTKERLSQSGLEVLGLIINGVIVNQEPDNYLRHVKAYHEEMISLASVRL